MLITVFIAFGIVACGIALTWFAIELTFRVPQNDGEKRRVRLALGAVCTLLVALTVWGSIRGEQSSDRSERELNNLPQRIGEYIRNTTPPFGWSTAFARPNPPEGLIAVNDGDLGSFASSMADQITNFVFSQGETPSRKLGENDVDFVIRSNAWYSNVMDQYKKQFGAQVITLVNLLTDKGALDGQVDRLAKDPVNPIGIKALAEQLLAASKKYKAEYGPH